MGNTILASIAVIVVVTLILVALLLWIKTALTPSGTVKININNGTKELEVTPGGDVMHTLADNGIFLPSACGGKANCGQCKLQVLEGGGTILPTETGFFSRKQIKEGWRLGCQVKVKDNIAIAVPESALSVKKLECEVISNENVATFIKEFTVKLPEGEHIDFKSGEYIQIDIPEYEADFSDMGVADIYKGDWEKYGITSLKFKNTVPTIRAYSMASYPAEKDLIKLNVRIATPPFDRTQPKGVFKFVPGVPPGIASTYVFSRKPGDKVWISGPYGEFLLPKDDPDSQEYIFVGGGAGMAPLRSHIMHLFKTLKTKKEVHFFYGARALVEAGFPQLPLPSGPGPSGSRSRCRRRQVHRWLRAQRDERDLPQEPRGSRGHQVLHVRSAHDDQVRVRPPGFPGRCTREHPLRQLRRLIVESLAVSPGFF